MAPKGGAGKAVRNVKKVVEKVDHRNKMFKHIQVVLWAHTYFSSVDKYYLHLKMVISFLKSEIFRESLFTFLLQKLHFDTSLTVLEKRISHNDAKGFKSKQTL